MEQKGWSRNEESTAITDQDQLKTDLSFIDTTYFFFLFHYKVWQAEFSSQQCVHQDHRMSETEHKKV